MYTYLSTSHLNTRPVDQLMCTEIKKPTFFQRERGFACGGSNVVQTSGQLLNRWWPPITLAFNSKRSRKQKGKKRTRNSRNDTEHEERALKSKVDDFPRCVVVSRAGVPDPPKNCSISNQTLSSFEIDCNEGYDGGIPQHFKMHVFDIKTRALLANLTSSSPRFALHLGSASSVSNSATPGSGGGGPDETPRTHSWRSSSNNANSIIVDEVTNKTARRHSNGGVAGVFFGSIAVIPPVGTLLQVTAVNAHGVSESVFIEATQQAVVGLLPAEMQVNGGIGGGGFSNFEFTPTLGILIGIVATGIFMMGTLIAALRFRQRKKPAHQQQQAVIKDKDRDMDSYNGNDYIELGTKDPDVIAQDKSGNVVCPRLTEDVTSQWTQWAAASISFAGMDSMPHITSNPLDLMGNGRPPSNTSTLPLRGDSPSASSAIRSSQVRRLSINHCTYTLRGGGDWLWSRLVGGTLACLPLQGSRSEFKTKMTHKERTEATWIDPRRFLLLFDAHSPPLASVSTSIFKKMTFSPESISSASTLEVADDKLVPPFLVYNPLSGH